MGGEGGRGREGGGGRRFVLEEEAVEVEVEEGTCMNTHEHAHSQAYKQSK